MAHSEDEAAPARQYKDHNFVVADEHLAFVAERLAGFAIVGARLCPVSAVQGCHRSRSSERPTPSPLTLYTLRAETHAAGSTRFLHIDAALSATLGVDDNKLLFLPVKDAYPHASADVVQRLEDAVVSGTEFAEVLPSGESGAELLVVACSASEPASHARATKPADTLAGAGSDVSAPPGQNSSPAAPEEVRCTPPIAAQHSEGVLALNIPRW